MQADFHVKSGECTLILRPLPARRLILSLNLESVSTTSRWDNPKKCESKEVNEYDIAELAIRHTKG